MAVILADSPNRLTTRPDDRGGVPPVGDWEGFSSDNEFPAESVGLRANELDDFPGC